MLLQSYVKYVKYHSVLHVAHYITSKILIMLKDVRNFLPNFDTPRTHVSKFADVALCQGIKSINLKKSIYFVLLLLTLFSN